MVKLTHRVDEVNDFKSHASVVFDATQENFIVD